MQRLARLLLTLNHETYQKLEKIAARKGLSVQQLIRKEVLPEWVARQEKPKKKR